MASDNYNACLAFTLRFEGGWSNHPKDPGGATMKGVIQRVYDGYRQRRGLPKRSVRYIEEQELQSIYRYQYWNTVCGDNLPAGVDLVVWDFGVNSGPARAIKYLQKALGVKIDGVIGEATLHAIEQQDPVTLAKKICDLRMQFLRSLGTFKTFGKGWTSRVNSCRALAVKMATEAAPMRDTITPLPEAPEEPVEEVSPKADREPTVTDKKGFLDSVLGGLTTVGTAITGIVSGIPVPVALAIVGVLAVGGGIYWYLNYYKKEDI